jgi:hypothetical protein
VYDYGLNKWVNGFYSYDRRGIIFYSELTHKYEFSGTIVSIYDRSVGGSGSPYIPYCNGIRWDQKLKKAIDTEDLICADLHKSNVENYKIHHLPNSGHYSGGSDIVISFNDVDPQERPYDTVMRGFCGIEVLGVTKRYDNEQCLSFTYNKYVDFRKWRDNLNKNDVLPVIAWYYEGESWFVIMTDRALYDGFYIGDGEKRHQQTNYSLVRKLKNYKLTPDRLFARISRHLHTIDTIRDLEQHKPIPIGRGKDDYLYSPGYPHCSISDYDLKIENIRRYRLNSYK